MIPTNPSLEKKVTKRRSNSKKAQRERRDRRKNTLLKKAYEFCVECRADVCLSIRLKDSGQIVIFNSDSSGTWPLPESQIVRPQHYGKTLLGTDSSQDKQYPIPIRKSLEDLKVSFPKILNEATARVQLGYHEETSCNLS